MTTTANLPETVHSYLTAHRNGDLDAAVATFWPDATVADEGRTHRGAAEIREWLATAASEYTYTVELVGSRRLSDDRWIATQHLEGDFPGGVVDLHFDFTLRDDRIHHLAIAP